MLTMWFLLMLSLLAPSGQVSAQEILEVEPKLAAEQTRTFLDHVFLPAENTLGIQSPASDLVVGFSSDTPFALRVTYPFQEFGRGENAPFIANPLDALEVELPPTGGRVSIDLTRSPAWAPWRNMYVLTVAGSSGSTVQLHDVSIRPPSFLRSLSAAARHFSLDEPILLSSINFLWGYRVLGVNFTVVMGVLSVLALIVTLFHCYIVRKASPRQPPQSCVKNAAVICLIALLLYDARFSLDIARLTLTDLREWYGFGPTSPTGLRGTGRLTTDGAGEYRQLGPIHQLAAFLEEERRKRHSGRAHMAPMKVVVCYDGNDVLKKQLRYLLYPTPVLSVEESWQDASHAVFIDTERWGMESGTISCGEQYVRRGELLKEFPHQSRVVRFTPSEHLDKTRYRLRESKGSPPNL